MLLHSDLFKQSLAYINDSDHGWNPDRCIVDGQLMGTGLHISDAPVSAMYATAGEFPDELLVPENEIKERLEFQINDKGSLFDLREYVNGLLDSLNQGHFGLCWNFSTTKSRMYTDAMQGQPILPLSPWYGAGIINRWADRGGQGAASMAFAAQYGGPLLSFCPSYDSKYATPEAAADGAKRKMQKFWSGSQNDKDKRTHQMVSAFLIGRAPVVDLNWMGHSMCGCRLVSYTSLSKLEVDTDNSWGMSAGVKGLYRLADSKARPDDLVIPCAGYANAA